MGEAKPTPGLWEVGKDRRGVERVYAGDHEIVRALSEHGSRRLSEGERQANRRLIAAAPDMLAACAEMVLHVNASHVPAPVIDAMRAAIAKAEGA